MCVLLLKHRHGSLDDDLFAQFLLILRVMLRELSCCLSELHLLGVSQQMGSSDSGCAEFRVELRV